MRNHRRALWLALFAWLALPALMVEAQTVLLVVRERADSKPLPPPFASREAISATLFDAGCIVFDAPGSDSPVPVPLEAARLARSAGAEVVLEVIADYQVVDLAKDLKRVSTRMAYRLIEAATSGILAQGTREGTNQDRERDVDQAGLGQEVGRLIAQDVERVLIRRSAGS